MHDASKQTRLSKAPLYDAMLETAVTVDCCDMNTEKSTTSTHELTGQGMESQGSEAGTTLGWDR